LAIGFGLNVCLKLRRQHKIGEWISAVITDIVSDFDELVNKLEDDQGQFLAGLH
jgi:hypothetical protein